MKRHLPAHCYLRKRSGGRVYVYFERGGKAAGINLGNPKTIIATAALRALVSKEAGNG